MKIIPLLLAVLALAAPARAIELSLEENRAERGSVGYVDTARLFAVSPDAARARAGFEELVRQAEERVNLRKAELLKLRADLAAVRADRERLASSTETAPAPTQAPSPAPAPAVSTAAAKTSLDSLLAAPVASTSAAKAGAPAAAVSTAAVAASTAAARAPLSLPGMSGTETAPTAPPSGAKPAVAPSTAGAAVPAAPAAPSAAPAGPSLGQRLLEMDAKIVSLQADILRKESEVAHEHDDADKGLLDVENRKTDQVLARLYRAISEVSRREGVSVVVDKTTVLYGHPAVDLTDKVLKYLQQEPARENPQP